MTMQAFQSAGEVQVPITETCSLHKTEFLNVTGQVRYDCPQCLQTEIRVIQVRAAHRERMAQEQAERDTQDSSSVCVARLLLFFMVMMPVALFGGMVYRIWRG